MKNTHHYKDRQQAYGQKSRDVKSDIFDKIKKERGGVAKIHSAFKDFPIGVEAHYEFYREILLREDLPLPRIDREYLAVKTSQANACEYCISHHSIALENHEKETGMQINREKRLFYDELAKNMTREPYKTRNMALKEMASKAGLSNTQFSHALFVVGYFNMVNRLALTMNIELEEDFTQTCG